WSSDVCSSDLFGLVCARPQPSQVPPRGFVQEVRVHLRAKNRFREFHLADFLAIQIDDVHHRHISCPSRDLKTVYFALLALRMKMYRPLGPGTDPFTK